MSRKAGRAIDLCEGIEPYINELMAETAGKHLRRRDSECTGDKVGVRKEQMPLGLRSPFL